MKKHRESARNQMCQVRIPRICNFNPETTVLAHLGGAGMGIKSDDRHASFCCSACHDAVDGRIKITGYTVDEIKLMFLEGVIRTQKIWITAGLM